MKLLLKNGHLITMDDKCPSIHEGYILIENEKIRKVGQMKNAPLEDKETKSLDLKGNIVIPGLINLHDHPCASLLRATGQGIYLEDWIPRVALPMVDVLNSEFLEFGSKYQAAEMLLNGITTCFEHLVNTNDEDSFSAIVKPAAELGLRQFVAKELRHAPITPISPELPIPHYPRNLRQELTLASRLVKEWSGSFGGLVQVAFALEAGATWLLSNATSDELICQGEKLACKLDILISCHISATPFRAYKDFLNKTGLGEIEYIHKLKALSDRWLFVHALNLQEKEIELLAKVNASVCHCPVSNAYSADGIADIPKFLNMGIRCGLGTDGAYVAGKLDIFETMKFCNLIHNVRFLDPKILSSERVLRMATIDAARILGKDTEIGSIEAGKCADLLVLQLKKLSSWPVIDLPSALVNTAGTNNVQHVFTNGRHIVQNGKLFGANLEELLDQAKYFSQKLRKKAKLEWLENYWHDS